METIYRDYWEDLASRLADIRHSEAEPHFFLLSESAGDLKELEKALRNHLVSPMLVLDEEEIVADGSSEGGKVRLMGAFTILEKVDPGHAVGLRELRIRTRQIARKLVNRMKRDSRHRHSEGSALILANAIQLGEIRQYAAPLVLNQFTGWTVEFEWLLPDDIAYGISDFA